MNKQIEALADEAEDYADGIVDQGGEFHPAYTRKFAELIVKETINEMIGQLWNYGIDESNNPSFYKAVERAKQHFGVK